LQQQGVDPSPLGLAAVPDPRQLGQVLDSRLMGSECSQTQGFWVRHLRGVQSS